MNVPKVSIVLCNYNQEAFVEKAIESALQQTYPHLEVVVIDNGSTDGSKTLLQKYASRPSVVLRLHETNLPVTRRLNEGVKLATGDFVGILYADDYYLPTKIERQMEAFLKLSPDYGVVYSPGLRLNVVTGEMFNTLSMKRDGNVLKEMFTEYHQEGFIDPVSPLVRKQCFLDFPFRENVFIEGEGIFFRVATKYKFFYLDERLSIMADHMGNAGKAIKKTKEYEVQLIKELLNESFFPKKYHAIAREYLARVIRNYGWQALRIANDTQWARVCFREAVSWSWKQLFHPRVWGGTLLSLIPKRALDSLNQTASRWLGRPGLLVLKENNV